MLSVIQWRQNSANTKSRVGQAGENKEINKERKWMTRREIEGRAIKDGGRTASVSWLQV